MKVPPYFPGFLIVIEGIDGVGKTTQADLLQKRLEERNVAVLRSKEPTTGKWGRMLRESAITGRLSLPEEVEAFMNDRREHVETKIMPALRSGKIVILDRYYFSTAAYQGARGLDPQELIRRNEEFAPEPDLLVLLDLEVDGGLDRVRSRGSQTDEFEQTDALRRAREIFLGISKPYLLKIDARRSADAIALDIVCELSRRYLACAVQSGTVLKSELRETFQLFASPGK
jgi:dTMP kinase